MVDGRDPTRSDEDYLAAVLGLEEDGLPPIQARVAERMGVSSAGVSEAVPRLVERGYLEPGQRFLRLTATGRSVGLSVVRRHRLAERLLADVLDLAWEKVHREATRWEHVISDDVEERLVDVLGDPATCPHGNPIPGSRRPVERRRAIPLAAASTGDVTVARISEHLQIDEQALVMLARGALRPGCDARVTEVSPEAVHVLTAAGARRLPAAVAAHVWVYTA